MKSFVLVSRRNGSLVEGCRIAFILDEQPLTSLEGYSVSMTSDEATAWLVYHPDASPLWLHLPNKIVARDFEILGEL